MTFFEETVRAIAFEGKRIEDVQWVGSKNGQYAISWEEFEQISQFTYDSGYGGREIARDIVVVGDGWWFERGEYDGSEWWEFKQIPVKNEARPFTKVKTDYSWDSIKDCEEPEEEDEDYA